MLIYVVYIRLWPFDTSSNLMHRSLHIAVYELLSKCRLNYCLTIVRYPCLVPLDVSTTTHSTNNG